MLNTRCSRVENILNICILCILYILLTYAKYVNNTLSLVQQLAGGCLPSRPLHHPLAGHQLPLGQSPRPRRRPRPQGAIPDGSVIEVVL